MGGRAPPAERQRIGDDLSDFRVALGILQSAKAAMRAYDVAYAEERARFAEECDAERIAAKAERRKGVK
jgi:uncharacterized protein